MRTFTLERTNDESGVSGTGQVLEGVEFSDGKVVLEWTSKPASTVIWNSFEDFWKIHVLSHPTNGSVCTFSDGTQIFQEPKENADLWRAS